MSKDGVPEFVGDDDKGGRKSPARSEKSSGSRTTQSTTAAALDVKRKEESLKYSTEVEAVKKQIRKVKEDLELKEMAVQEEESILKKKVELLTAIDKEDPAFEGMEKEIKELQSKLESYTFALKKQKILSKNEVEDLEGKLQTLKWIHEVAIAKVVEEEVKDSQASMADLERRYHVLLGKENHVMDGAMNRDLGGKKDHESSSDKSETPDFERNERQQHSPLLQDSLTEAIRALAQGQQAIAQSLSSDKDNRGFSGNVTEKVLLRQSIGKDLPVFAGRPEQWHTFIAAFQNTTKLGGYDDASNVERLRKCLKGEALRCVETLLVSGDSLSEVMETLEMRFGQPEVIITSLIEKTRSLPPVKDGNPQSIIDFGTAVKNLVVTIKNLKMDRDLENPALLREFKNKLPYRMKADWMDKIIEKKKSENLTDFSGWLERHVRIACSVYVPKSELDERPRKREEPNSPRKSQKYQEWEYKNPPIAAGLASVKQNRAEHGNANSADHGKENRAERGSQQNRRNQCLFCKEAHSAQDCDKKMTFKQKKAKITEAGACYVCLKKGHFAATCYAKPKCDQCEGNHLSIMCHGGRKDQPKLLINGNEEITTNANTAAVSCTKAVLLKTVVVRIKGPKGSMLVRLMSDEGSQTSLVGRNVVDALGLQAVGSTMTRNVLCGGHVTPLHEEILRDVTIESLDGKVQRTWVLNEKETICPGLPRIPNGPWMNKLKRKKVFLSDWDQTVVDDPDVQILIGSDHWGELVTKTRINLSEDLLAVKTLFGWCLSGCLPRSSLGNVHVQMALGQAQVQDLWNLESIGIMDKIEVIKEEELAIAAQKDFDLHVKSKKSGFYEVALPWMVEKPELPTNRNVAEKRLRSATKKMQMNDQVRLYDAIFKTWLEEGFIEKVPTKQVPLNATAKGTVNMTEKYTFNSTVQDALNSIVENTVNFTEQEAVGRCHYIPHRAVFKPQSLTTPVRPVFDASCKMGRQMSLNECLYKGPNLIALIPAVLYRFRENAVGVTADIRKAFQMIEVREEDRDYLRFLWWEDPTCQKIQEYRHRRVVFGLTCSPFLLAAVLEKHCKEVGGVRSKELSEKLIRSLYVDNCVTSVNSVGEYMLFKDFSSGLLKECKMDLREWEYGPCSASEKKVSQVLGLVWNKVEDTLSVQIPPLTIDKQLTMRSLLSAIHSVFDPIGILSPVLLQPKLLLQEAWEQKKGMDHPLNEDACTKFKRWYDELPILTNFGIPRKMFGKEGLQLHCFVDASKYAYACVVYARYIEDGEVKIKFVHAKARVAPLKKCTIPRLELMACWMGAELIQFIKKSLDLDEVPVFFWSDSSTAISWITLKCEWGTFVGNRVKRILAVSTPEQWRFVPGILNPADLPSRGCSPQEFWKSGWESGPEFLKKPEAEWPKSRFEVDEDAVKNEVKKTARLACVATENKKCWFFDRPEKKITSFRGNVKVMSWVQQFIKNAKNAVKDRSPGPVNARELNTVENPVMKTAENTVIKIIQQQCEVGTREEKGGLKLIQIGGLWRVKTRLLNKQDTEDFKLPVFLPKTHPLVPELIKEYHEKYCHAGTQIMLSKLREHFWIEHGRRTIKKALKTCLKCQRSDVSHLEVEPADLPEKRVEAVEVFTTVGVDLAGPLQLRDNSKVWIVVYTCAVYRCVVFDVVTSLSTEAFLMSLERFINTHGRPSTIYSDNGTNFVGAANLLRKVNWKQIEKASDAKKIRWIFNPPAAPWWGGWWERLIRSAKDLLRRTLGKASLNFDQLRTCLTAVGAVMNDRPLTLIGEDPDDLIPLTPAMFLHPTRNCQLPEGQKFDGTGLIKIYKKVQVLKQELQDRFRSEYLSQLVQRGKEKTSRVPEVGDVVLIGFENKKRWEWPLGRVIELLPGKDTKTRAAKIKTKFGIWTRPLQRLYPLELPTPHEIKISPEVKEIAKEKTVPVEVPVVTRSGRQSKKPCRYGVWNHQVQ